MAFVYLGKSPWPVIVTLFTIWVNVTAINYQQNNPNPARPRDPAGGGPTEDKSNFRQPKITYGGWKPLFKDDQGDAAVPIPSAPGADEQISQDRGNFRQPKITYGGWKPLFKDGQGEEAVPIPSAPGAGDQNMSQDRSNFRQPKITYGGWKPIFKGGRSSAEAEMVGNSNYRDGPITRQRRNSTMGDPRMFDDKFKPCSDWKPVTGLPFRN